MPNHSDTTLVRVLNRIRGIADAIHRRLEREDGFTLVELTIVLLVLGILMTIAVPSYLSFKDRAGKTAAKADVAETMRAVVAYGADNYPNAANDPNADATDSGYTGITLPLLATKYDASISTVAGAPFVINPAGFTPTSTDFCLLRPSAAGSRCSMGPATASRRHVVHARYLHGQLTPGPGGESREPDHQPADSSPGARRRPRRARARSEHIRHGWRQVEDGDRSGDDRAGTRAVEAAHDSGRQARNDTGQADHETAHDAGDENAHCDASPREEGGACTLPR